MERFSFKNRQNQVVFRARIIFNSFLKNHTITAGASYESFKFENSFNLVAYGPTLFFDGDIQDFKTKVPLGLPYVFGFYPLDVDVNYAANRAVADKWTLVELTVGQISAYLQDEWHASENFRLTYGLRLDKPVYMEDKFRFTDPNFNPDGTFANSYTEGSPTLQNNDNLTLFDADGNPVSNGAGKDLDNTRLPTKKPLISPRVGFNWDVRGDKSFQVSGGSGLFAGL